MHVGVAGQGDVAAVAGDAADDEVVGGDDHDGAALGADGVDGVHREVGAGRKRDGVARAGGKAEGVVVLEEADVDGLGGCQRDVCIGRDGLEGLFGDGVGCAGVLPRHDVGQLAVLGAAAAIDDADVEGVEEEGAAAGGDCAAEDELLLAGDLDEAACSACRAGGRDAAAVDGGAVGPHDHRAAAACEQGVGFDASVAADIGRRGVAQVGLALVAAADEHGATAGGARGVDRRVVHRHLVGEHLHGAAGAFSGGGVQDAGDLDGAACAAFDGDVGGLDGARVADSEGQHVACAEKDGTLGGHNLADVLDGGLAFAAALYLNHDLAASRAEEHLVACDHGYHAFGGDDGAVVGHVLAEEPDGAGTDGAPVDHLAVEVHKAVDAAEEVLVADVARCGVDRADVHHCPLAEIDAGGVDEVDLAIGLERAVDLCGRSAADPVENSGQCARLDKAHRLLLGDVEALIVDDTVVTRFDGRQVAVALEARGAMDDLLADRPAERRAAEQDGENGDPQEQSRACTPHRYGPSTVPHHLCPPVVGIGERLANVVVRHIDHVVILHRARGHNGHPCQDSALPLQVRRRT